MRTYEEAYAAANDRPAFSNSTDGEAWMGNWCEQCVNDSPELVDAGNGCPLIMVALMNRTPSEWIRQDPATLGDQYHCTEYREPGDGDDEPGPPPENPDQITIFDEFVDQAVEQFQALEPAVTR